VSTHHFARAVFYGQNGQLRYAGKEAQQVANACKWLVQNAIVGWNCRYLTRRSSKLRLLSAKLWRRSSLVCRP